MNGWVGGRSKEFWVLSLPVLPGYRSGALANLREEAPSHTASLGRVAPPSPSGSHNLRCMIIYSRRLPGARVRGERGQGVCTGTEHTQGWYKCRYYISIGLCLVQQLSCTSYQMYQTNLTDGSQLSAHPEQKRKENAKNGAR